MSEQQGSGEHNRLGSHGEHRLMRIGIIALVVVVLLGFGSMAIQQSAWSQGYLTGLVAGGGDGDTLAQYVLYSNRGVGHSTGFGFVWLLALGLFLFFAIGKFMRMRAWQMTGGAASGDWPQHGRHGGPPWRRPCPEPESQPQTESQPTTPADSTPAAPSTSADETPGQL